MAAQDLAGGAEVACWAPRSALYLTPNGRVQACCVTGFGAGWVTGPNRQSLREIWDGAALARQGEVLARGSYELGCQECGVAAAVGERDRSLAPDFDQYATTGRHEFPLLIDFALSNRCNLQCVMCTGNLSSAIRSQREHLPPLPPAYDDRFFEELDDFLPHLRRARFKGGEPFLARENRRIWDRLLERGLRPVISVTTNGTQWDEQIAHYVSALEMQPVLSTDAVDDDVLESIRVGVSARTFWANLERFQAAAPTRQVTLSVCLMANNWRQLGPMLLEGERRGCNVHLCLVNQPVRFDLLRLPRHELDEVRAELIRTAPALQTELAQQTWDSVVRMLEPAKAVPVQVSVRFESDEVLPMTPRALTDAEAGELRAELAAELGVEGVELSIDQDLVSSVSAPDWAADLGCTAWIGRPLTELPALVEAAIGGTLTAGEMPTVQRNTTRYVLALVTDEGRQLLRVTQFEVGPDAERHVLLHPESLP